MAFFTVWLRRENKRDRKQEGNFSLWTHFFILPIWKENEEEKVLKNALYTNTLNLSFIFFLSSLFLGRCPFSFLFQGNHVASYHFFFLFFFMGINIASLFFSNFFFLLIFQGLGMIVYFIFNGCDFFWNMFFIFIKNFG